MLLLFARGSSQDGGYFFLAWMAVIGFVMLVAYLYEQKRKKAIAAAAANLEFVPNEDLVIPCDMPLLKRSSFAIRNIYTGSSVGLEAAFFDVQVGQGRGSYTQTVAGFRRPGLVIPPFEFHETNFGDRIAGFFPSKIVRVDSDLNFSSRYTLRSVNPEEVKIFFTPEIAAHFVQLPPHGWTIEGSDDSVIVYRSRKRVSPSNLSNFLNETGNVAAGFLGLLRPTSVF
jgi:cbb3-type cytochrome oxidase subunit 3